MRQKTGSGRRSVAEIRSPFVICAWEATRTRATGSQGPNPGAWPARYVRRGTYSRHVRALPVLVRYTYSCGPSSHHRVAREVGRCAAGRTRGTVTYGCWSLCEVPTEMRRTDQLTSDYKHVDMSLIAFESSGPGTYASGRYHLFQALRADIECFSGLRIRYAKGSNWSRSRPTQWPMPRPVVIARYAPPSSRWRLRTNPDPLRPKLGRS